MGVVMIKTVYEHELLDCWYFFVESEVDHVFLYEEIQFALYLFIVFYDVNINELKFFFLLNSEKILILINFADWGNHWWAWVLRLEFRFIGIESENNWVENGSIFVLIVERRKLLNGLEPMLSFFMFKLKRLDTSKKILGKELSDFFIERWVSKITMRKDHNVHDGRFIALKDVLEVIKL